MHVLLGKGQGWAQYERPAHTADTPCHQGKQDWLVPVQPQGDQQREMSQKLLDLKTWCFQYHSPQGLNSPDLSPVPLS